VFFVILSSWRCALEPSTNEPRPKRVIFVVGVRRKDMIAVVEKVELPSVPYAAATYFDERAGQENAKWPDGINVWVPIEASDTEEERIQKAFMAGMQFHAWHRGEWEGQDK
jgi:hypothetical protein